MTLVVLGGSGGIGRALVAAHKGPVVVLDLAAALHSHPPPCTGLEVDVRQPETLAKAVDGIEGEIIGFVNLCGYMAPPTPIHRYDPAVWNDVIAGNLSAAFHASRAVAPRVVKGGAIVQVGSGLGHNARPGFGAYAIAKAGISAMTRQLALELAPDIRVNCVAPSAVDTAFLRGGTGRSEEQGAPPVDLDSYAQAIPLKRIAQPADVVGPVQFLLSDAARYVTGQTLHVNGGAYMP